MVFGVGRLFGTRDLAEKGPSCLTDAQKEQIRAYFEREGHKEAQLMTPPALQTRKSSKSRRVSHNISRLSYDLHVMTGASRVLVYHYVLRLIHKTQRDLDARVMRQIEAEVAKEIAKEEQNALNIRNLCNIVEERLSQVPPRAQLYKIVRLIARKHHRRLISESDEQLVREFVKRHARNAPQDNSISALCDMFERECPQHHLTRPQLYYAMNKEWKNQIREPVTHAQRAIVADAVQEHLEQHAEFAKLSLVAQAKRCTNALSAQLVRQTHLSETQIIQLIRSRVKQHNRPSLTTEDRSRIEEHISQKRHTDAWDTRTLTHELHMLIPHIPRREVYYVVRSTMRKMEHQRVSADVREYVASVQQACEASTVGAICDKIMACCKSVLSGQRDTPDSVPLPSHRIANQILTLSENQLAQLVHKAQQNANRRLITDDSRQQVRDFLTRWDQEHGSTSTSTAQIVDALQSHVALPRDTLVYMVGYMRRGQK